MRISDGRCPAIVGIGTAVPPFRVMQADAAKRLAETLSGNKDAARWARRIFQQCGVDMRYTCEPSLLEPAGGSRYFPGAPVREAPKTAERMQAYEREAPPLLLEAAEGALADSGKEAYDITHLITVSCTGMVLPGLDALLVKRMGLRADVVRLPLYYLGCAAGLKAIGLARGIAAREPGATVLIACVELCTLHLQPADTRESLFGAAFFGDGASACVVGEAGANGASFALGEYRSELLPAGGEEMTWHIGDTGFTLYLSPRIPELLAEYLPGQVRLLLGDAPEPPLWAIHPGGRGIVEAVQRSFGLSGEQTEASLSVLRRYGNMSSATILFVLDELRRSSVSGQNGVDGVAMAFGPGLTTELLRFRRMQDGSGAGRAASAGGAYAR